MSSYYTGPLANLIGELNKLPGIGPKSAQRLAFYLLQRPSEEVHRLADSILEAKERIRFCSTCYNLTEQNPCAICSDEQRNPEVVCVVEQARDVVAFERTRGFRGKYHVLQGVISPIDGIGPEKLRIKELVKRVEGEVVKEVVVATNLNAEGDVTAMYLARLLKPLGIKVTRLAQGLPVGSDLEYADEVTLGKALEGRREL
ncbi:MAG: recombination protein RecR [Firmicutes bacterium]|nr:recombination protein RecR [Bacillota bacterium]